MKYILLFIFSCFYRLSVAYAQQLPLYSLDPELHGLINPASVYCDFLKYERVISGGTAYRTQWTGLPQNIAPMTLALHGEYIYLGQHRMVIGGYLQHDRVGITESTGGYGRFAYIFTDDDPSQGGVSFGMNFGVVGWQLRTRRLTLAQLDDPNLPLDEPSVRYPDVGLGIYAYKNLGERGKYIYGGLSAPRFFDIRNSSDISPERNPHVYALAGIHYAPTNGSTIEVSTWIRKVKYIPMQASLNARVQLMKRATFGFGLVSNLPKLFNETPFVTLEVGINLTLRETFVGKLTYVRSFFGADYFGTTHEVNLSFALETPN